jgi:hypothetical protein
MTMREFWKWMWTDERDGGAPTWAFIMFVIALSGGGIVGAVTILILVAVYLHPALSAVLGVACLIAPSVVLFAAQRRDCSCDQGRLPCKCERK